MKLGGIKNFPHATTCSLLATLYEAQGQLLYNFFKGVIMPKLCISCSKADPIKRLINEKGKKILKCKICGTRSVNAMDCRNNRLKQLFKALIRYHFSERDYNTHWGGGEIESLFLRENPILNYSDHFNKEALYETVFVLVDKIYEEYERGITLFAGYGEYGKPNMLLEAIKSNNDDRLNSIASDLSKKNHFLLTDRGLNLIQEHIPLLESSFPQGEQFYRARIGYEQKGIPGAGWGEEWHFKPYKGSDIGAPPPLKATPGRMNRDGISFLYLATDLETVIAEIRPHPSHIISICMFTSKVELRIADFNSIDIYDYYLSDKKLDDFFLLKSINTLFSLPVPPDQRYSYSITQFLSDVLRILNFDGIAYRSSVGPGSNLTIFDPDKFEYIPGSARVVRAEQVSYTFKELPVMTDGEDYTVFKDGKWVY